jgi:hypothetical protein
MVVRAIFPWEQGRQQGQVQHKEAVCTGFVWVKPADWPAGEPVNKKCMQITGPGNARPTQSV